MIQFTVFSSAFAFWILFCLLCSIVHAVPTESPSSDDRFDTSQSGLSSLLNSDQTHLDFWNEGDLQFQSNDFANGFAGTSSASAIEIEPDSSDLFDTTTTTFSLVGNNDPYLASTSYVNGDDATFQESEMAQIAVDAAASSCELGARDSELSIDVDVDVDVDRISRRDHRDFGDIIDFGKHDCPLGKEAACCASGRPETVYNSIRMRPGCTAWGEIFFERLLKWKIIMTCGKLFDR